MIIFIFFHAKLYILNILVCVNELIFLVLHSVLEYRRCANITLIFEGCLKFSKTHFEEVLET